MTAITRGIRGARGRGAFIVQRTTGIITSFVPDVTTKSQIELAILSMRSD